MSSKVLTRDGAQAATPMVWQQVQAPPSGPDAAPGAPLDLAAGMAQVERQSEQRIREAHAAGLREGEAAGRNRAAAEFQPVVERMARSIEELCQMRARLRREAEADLVRLSLAIARRVLRRELAIDPDALRGLVLAALEKLQAQEICRVRLHPSHAGLISACLREAVSGSSVEVIPDPSRQPGDVVFETERGNLDVSVDSQLREIERGLADRLRKHA
ncbi:MAG: FliH/SctL family protein [Bryobacteraceae bacterium]